MLSKKLRSLISGQMRQYPNVFKEKLITASRTLVLDYLFGEGQDMDAYQIVRFSQGEPWHVLHNGFLLGSLNKVAERWILVDGKNLCNERVIAIGNFIDSQHFNLLPDKIKMHWVEQVQEVIMENDSSYMVICREGIEFSRFKLMFCSFIPELIEEEWPVKFSVYNAAFSDDFEVEVI